MVEFCGGARALRKASSATLSGFRGSTRRGTERASKTCWRCWLAISALMDAIFKILFSSFLVRTRESLFQPVFKNKVTQSPMPSNLRFSTFGYQDPQVPGAPPPCPSHGPSKQNTLPHQHSHHHHYHHIHSSSNKSSPDVDKGVGTSEAFEVDERTKKILVKKDDAQARSYSDVRKSAPDVIIIAGCTSSHWRF